MCLQREPIKQQAVIFRYLLIFLFFFFKVVYVHQVSWAVCTVCIVIHVYLVGLYVLSPVYTLK